MLSSACYVSGSDEDEENVELNQLKFTPKQINDLIFSNSKLFTDREENQNITVIGDVNSFKKWKRSGCSFKITMNDNSLDCKAWEKDGLSSDFVSSFENKRCFVKGQLTSEIFQSRISVKFCVTDISTSNKESEKSKLKVLCEGRGFFEARNKSIKYGDLNKIGIISKIGTQGYDDFINQLKVPIDIVLEEITLEGEKTKNECINAIKKLEKETDMIIIIRGGGDTGLISDSYDKIELFETIKKSTVPVLTAIGHDMDKGDKLLITSVSDFDFPTPTAAAKELNKFCTKIWIDKIENILLLNDDNFCELYDKIEQQLYDGLGCFVTQGIKDKFGGTIIEIDEDDTYLIVKKKEKYYRIPVRVDNEIHFTDGDLELKNDILEGLDDRNIDIVNSSYFKLIDKSHKLSSNIEDSVKKIKTLEKIKEKYDNSKKLVVKKMFLKCINTGWVPDGAVSNAVATTNLNHIIKNKQMLLMYKHILESVRDGIAQHDIKKIYKFVREEFN